MVERTRLTLTSNAGVTYTMTATKQEGPSFGRQFMVVFPDVMRVVARDRAAPPYTVTVLMELHERLQPDAWGFISQSEIGDAIGISGPTVSQCMKALQRHELVEKRGAGPRTEWRLSPLAGWKGTAGRFQAALRERAASTGKVTPLSAHRRPPVAPEVGAEIGEGVDA